MKTSDYFKKFSKNRNEELDFMENCEKADISDILNQKVHIDAYGICRNNDGIYSIFHVKETPEKFYFGGMAVTNKLQEIDNDGMHDALKEQTIEFVSRKSKNGRDYIDFLIDQF